MQILNNLYKYFAVTFAFMFLFIFAVEAQTGWFATPSASITIETGSKITVDGGDFVLETPKNSGAGASLIDRNPTSQVNAINGGTVIIKRFMPNRMVYISSPVEAASTNEFLRYTNYRNLWKHDPTRDWDNAWVKAGVENFEIMKGYAAHSLNAYPTIEFTGNPNTGDFTTGSSGVMALEYYPSAEPSKDGFNLLGNPYPSAINWDAPGIIRTNVDNTIYFWDGTANNYKYYNNGSPNDAQPSNAEVTVTVNGGSSIIPPMQGFMVRANAGGAELTIPNSARTHSTQKLYRKSGNNGVDLLKLKVRNGSNTDETVLRFISGATETYDGTYDAFKMFTNSEYYPEIPQLYTKTTDAQKLAINTLSNIEDGLMVNLGFKIGKNGTFTLNATQFIFDNVDVYLEDVNDPAVWQNLKEEPTYEFTSEAGDFDERFILHFSVSSINDDQNNDDTGNTDDTGNIDDQNNNDDTDETTNVSSTTDNDINIYTTRNYLFVNTPIAGTKTIEVYNLLGSKVFAKQTNMTGITRTQLNIPNGTYIIKVITNSKVNSKQVIIR